MSADRTHRRQRRRRRGQLARRRGNLIFGARRTTDGHSPIVKMCPSHGIGFGSPARSHTRRPTAMPTTTTFHQHHILYIIVGLRGPSFGSWCTFCVYPLRAPNQPTEHAEFRPPLQHATSALPPLSLSARTNPFDRARCGAYACMHPCTRIPGNSDALSPPPPMRCFGRHRADATCTRI